MTDVNLYDISAPMLLVPAKTGVTYHHQYGGCACDQAEIEGYVVPVAIRPGADSPFRTDGLAAVCDVIRALPDMGLTLRGDANEFHDEAFLPVTSPFGDAWLIWCNSD